MNVSITVFFYIFLNCISSRFRLILETCEKPKMLDRVGKYPRFVFRKYLVHRCIFEIPKYSGLTLIFWTSIVSKCTQLLNILKNLDIFKNSEVFRNPEILEL